MIHVEELRLRNFKSCRDVVLPLSDLTFLVGRNGCGKSAILDGFDFIREALTDSLPTAIERRDGMASLRHRLAGDDELTTVAVVLRLRHEVMGASSTFDVPAPSTAVEETTRVLYGFALGADGRVVREVLACDSAEFPTFDRTDPRIGAIQPDARRLVLPLTAGGASTSRMTGSTATNVPHDDFALAVVRDSVIRMFTCHPDPGRIRETTPIRHATELERDGRNLADVLQVCDGKRLAEALSAICEGVVDVGTVAHAGARRVRFQQQLGDVPVWFDASQMSDGTLRATAILAALQQSSIGASLVAIEELEDAIHPAGLAALIESAEAEVERPDRAVQVVVTTHSVELLSLPQATGERLRVIQRDQGATNVYAIHPGLWAERTPNETLGDLLRVNALFPADTPFRCPADPLALEP